MDENEEKSWNSFKVLSFGGLHIKSLPKTQSFSIYPSSLDEKRYYSINSPFIKIIETLPSLSLTSNIVLEKAKEIEIKN
jgi:hypothetical protein